MKKALFALLVCPLFAADGPHLFYSKSFPGSAPAYVEITLDHAGNAEYKEDPNDDQPLKFQLGAGDVNEIFGLVDKLGRLNHALESPAKVAFMGMKTFRFESGAQKNEVKFNFSEDADARLLQDWFERIAETEQNLFRLERAVKYDKLGVDKALLIVHAAFNNKRLVAPQQLLPLLDRIAKNETFMHMDRERAAALSDAIRAGK
ncbi:MAG TPA: hypothetical protein VLX58_21465 [Bryobacteraceae bacterium]|nr:hypothetical protein [Bryobacteraceae bacterium]